MLLRSPVWSSALFLGGDPLDGDAQPSALLETRGLKLARNAIHTIADPFVFAREELYLFAEVQRRKHPGRIEAWQVTPELEPLGELNFASGHMSFPFVFSHGEDIFILPETSGAAEVALYRFVRFPTKIEKVAVLLKGPFTDSSIVRHEGLFYLFTSADDKGLLYVGDSIDGPYKPHPGSPISSDQRYLRNAGAILPPSNQRPFLIRPVQNCSVSYGGDLSLMKIVELSAHAFSEEPWAEDVLTGRYPWCSTGAHHFSQCEWKGQTVTAVDGRQNDLLVNRILGLIR